MQLRQQNGNDMVAQRPTAQADLIRHAEQYPFDVPEASYLFAGGTASGSSADIDGRTPVLALGSNAAPAQLARKFGADSAPIMVSRALLRDHAVVYSAHFSAYGSLPATLEPSAGAATYVFVTWLDDRQLRLMHGSESLGVNYDFKTLNGIEVDVDGCGTIDHAAVYVSRAGALNLKGQPIRLAEVPTISCAFPALIQPAMLRCAHRQLAPELDYGRFMGRIVEDCDFRREASKRLRDRH